MKQKEVKRGDIQPDELNCLMAFAIGHQPIRMTVDVELGQDPRGPPAVRDSKVAG